MKHQVTQLFSIPLFYANIGELDKITKTFVKAMDYPDEAAGHDHTKDKTVLSLPKLHSLSQQIDDAVQYFIKDVLAVNDDVEFKLENSWINKHSKGEYNTLHWHSNAMLSGVYYIERCN